MSAVVSAPATVSTPAATPPSPAPGRSVALDAYRGLIMIFLISNGFGFGFLKADPFWSAFANQVDHVRWEGMVLWDLIQPAFMFMVGVAMPFSMGRRIAEGANFTGNFRHVLKRAAILIFLSQLFVAAGSGQFQFGLINVLSQIAFTYVIGFLLMHLAFPWQAAAAVGLLALHTGLFFAYPGAEGPFSQTGNVGQNIDQWLLGRNYPGLYVTINFISSAVTTLCGIWAGNLMRSQRADKLKVLLAGAAGLLASGWLLAFAIPSVKRIWTASFTLWSAGWVVLGLAAFVWLVDMKGIRRWTFPLVVVGMNSIFIYCVGQLFRGNIRRAVSNFTGGFEWIGTLAPVAVDCAVLGVMFYLCLWLYRRNIFIKV